MLVDFVGDALGYVDMGSGGVSKFRYLLVYSRISIIPLLWPYLLKVLMTFLYALGKCLEFFGGVPQILDNLKTAVIKAGKYELVLNKVLKDFAEHYGLVFIPARPRKLKDGLLV